jgi:tyrosyl-tRNA synthetase
MILQAYDFVELYKRHGCILQMGGSDQWGNIVNGIDLGRRLLDAELFALTTPLLTTSSGAKMGKTETGAVWLNADMMSPYDYWQFWRNCEDGDVARLLKLFTELPLREIGRLAALKGQELNEAKKVLATEATALLHGRTAAEQAAETARRTFEEGALAETLPTVEIPRARLEAGLGVPAAYVEVGFVSSNGEARRHIRGGGLRVNDETVTDEKMMLTAAHLTPEASSSFRSGASGTFCCGRYRSDDRRRTSVLRHPSYVIWDRRSSGSAAPRCCRWGTRKTCAAGRAPRRRSD